VNYKELLECASKLGISIKLITIWIPEDKYVDAHFSEDSLSITRESDPFFGLAFGPKPKIDSRWTHFSCTRTTPKTITQHVPLSGQWDAYGIATRSFDIKYNILKDFESINSFLEAHAPQSSIRAADPEVIAWIGIGEVALGAICKWESGAHVLSAIAVAENQRGKGFGKQITEALIDYAFENGIDYLALGVWAKNDAAIATYKSIGFEQLGQFNSFDTGAEGGT
jgi:ribosomal protein S18 acetylase RimI-like enzyme